MIERGLDVGFKIDKLPLNNNETNFAPVETFYGKKVPTKDELTDPDFILEEADRYLALRFGEQNRDQAINSTSRFRNIVVVRQARMAFLKGRGMGYLPISNLLGIDHSTVFNAVKKNNPEIQRAKRWGMGARQLDEISYEFDIPPAEVILKKASGALESNVAQVLIKRLARQGWQQQHIAEFTLRHRNTVYHATKKTEFSKPDFEADIREIIEQTSQETGIPVINLITTGNRRAASLAAELAMFRIREKYGEKFSFINMGRLFHRDPSTIVEGVQKGMMIAREMEIEEQNRQRVIISAQEEAQAKRDLPRILREAKTAERLRKQEEKEQTEREKIEKEKRNFTIANAILVAVADEYMVSVEAIVSPGKPKNVAQARQTAQYLLFTNGDFSFKSVANVVGRSHYTTAMYAVKTVETLLKEELELDPEDREFTKRIDDLNAQIKELLGINTANKDRS